MENPEEVKTENPCKSCFFDGTVACLDCKKKKRGDFDPDEGYKKLFGKEK